MKNTLPAGLYELLVTLGLRDAISQIEADGWSADVVDLDAVVVADMLADHIRDATWRSIANIRGEAPLQLAARLDLTNRLLAVLRDAAGTEAVREEDAVATDGQILREVREPSSSPLWGSLRARPHIPLRDSTLLVNAHRDFQIGTQVELEI